MRKTTTILVGLIFCVSSLVYAEEDSTKKYKSAPLPHYTEEKGYGWSIETPVTKPDHVWHILKVWRTETLFLVFVDKGKDGECDIVYGFERNGELNPSGSPYVARLPNSSCEEMEKKIKDFIEERESEVDL